MAVAKSGRLVVDDLTAGRNGFDAPWAIKDKECADAVNIDFYKSRLGNKRGGMLAPSTTGITCTGIISSAFRHVPTTNEALAEAWIVDDSATPIINRLAGGTTWAAPTLKDAPTGNGFDFTAASINGKLILAYKSAVDRLHCWDTSTVRRLGLLTPTAAPTGANTGSGGTLAFDAAGTLNYAAGTTFSHTCAVGATLLLVMIRADTAVVTTVTYNSVAMTQIAGISFTGNYYLYYLVSPASGAHTVAITSASSVGAASASYTGTAITGIPDASTTATNASATLTTTLTTVADRCWVAYAVADRGGAAPTAGTNYTIRATPSASTSMVLGDSNFSVTPPGAFSMTAGVNVAGGCALMASFGTQSPAYSALARYYRVRWTRQSSGVTIGRSEASAALSATPSGTGTAYRITQPTVANEGETHWEVEASTDGITYYRIATVAIGTTTYDDSAATSTYSSNPLSALAGVYTVFTSGKFLAADQNRLLSFGDFTATNKQARVWISAVIGSSDIGDEERIDTSAVNSYLDFDENDSGVATGLAGPVFGSYFAFKDRQVWKLTPTGVTTGPYKQDAVTKSIGALHHLAIAKGEDAAGNPALYWMSHRGLYRWSITGLEYIGRGIEDYILGPTATINLAATKSVARTVYHADKRQVWCWWTTGAANDCNQMAIYDVISGGLSRVPTGDLLANVRCAVMFSNTLGASMSRDLKPYVGQAGAAARWWKADTGTDDNGTNFQAYVDTKCYEPGGPGFTGSMGDGQLVAKAASGVTITCTTTTDFGIQTPTATAVLTPAGSETRVVKRLAASSLAGAGGSDTGQIRFAQFRLGDAAAISNAWTLDRLVVPIQQGPPDTQ